MTQAQSPKVSLDLTEWQILNHTLVSSTVKILVSGTDSSRGSDQGNALPYINIVMMFLQIICPLRETCANARSLLQSMPWTLIADRLTAMALSPTNVPERVSDPSRLQKFMPQRPDDMALMEDYYLRGLVWCEDYFPAKWFSTKDKDELSHQEGFKAHHSRCRRIIWSASMISMVRYSMTVLATLLTRYRTLTIWTMIRSLVGSKPGISPWTIEGKLDDSNGRFH